VQSGTARSETVRDSAQLNLRVLRWDGALPGFVLVHGLASNALLWRAGAEMLSQGDPRAGWGHAVTEIDLRGHGESDVPASGYDTATAAGDVAAVIATLGLGRPVVAGQSWGGNVAVELAARSRISSPRSPWSTAAGSAPATPSPVGLRCCRS